MPRVRSKSTRREKRAAPLPGTRLLGMQARRKAVLVRKVQAGFGFDRLLNLEKQSGLTRERIAEFVAITPRTMARRQKQRQLSPEESDRLLRASRVFEMAVDLFEGDVGEARRWMLTPNPALDNDTPLIFSSTDIGAREVEHLIGRLEHGVFA